MIGRWSIHRSYYCFVYKWSSYRSIYPSISRHCCSEIYVGDTTVHPKKTTKKKKKRSTSMAAFLRGKGMWRPNLSFGYGGGDMQPVPSRWRNNKVFWSFTNGTYFSLLYIQDISPKLTTTYRSRYLSSPILS